MTIESSDIHDYVFVDPGAIIVDDQASCLVIDQRIAHAPICVVFQGEHLPTMMRTTGTVMLGRLGTEELIRALVHALDADLATHPELQPPDNQGEPS